MGVQSCNGRGSYLLLPAGLQATRKKLTISGIPSCLNYYVIL